VQTQPEAEEYKEGSQIESKYGAGNADILIKEIQVLLTPHGVEEKTVAAAFNEIYGEIDNNRIIDSAEEFRIYALGTVLWKIFARRNTPWICPRTGSGNAVPIDLLVNAYSLWGKALHLAEKQGVDGAAAAEAFVLAAHKTADRISNKTCHAEIGKVRDAPQYLISAFRHLIPRIAERLGSKQIEDCDLSEWLAKGDISDQGISMEIMESGVLCWELLNAIPPYGRSIAIARLLHGFSWNEIADCFGTSVKAAKKALSSGIRNAFGLCLRRLQKMGYHKVVEVEKLLKNQKLAINGGCNMNARKKTNDFLAREDEKRIEEILRKAVMFCNHNPEREGCPDQALIRDLLSRKRSAARSCLSR
jgi:hypothetical protein